VSDLPRVLLAEADAPTRAGIRLLLEGDGFEICAEPVDADAAVAAALRERPHICLVDEDLPGGSVAAMDAISRGLPETSLLVLTGSEEPRSLLGAVGAGASGFVRKDVDPVRLPATLRGVLAGEAALSRRLALRVLESLRRRQRGRTAAHAPGRRSVTDRELEVLELMTEGLRTSEIAQRLSVAEVTVRRHRSSAMDKLGVADRAAALEVLTGRSRR
jgi:DNA-binding NarL/FixJ family response regulator